MTQVVKDHFTTDDLVRYTRLSRHMVNYLCRYGILAATLSPERRRGMRRKFSYADLLLGRAVAKLLSAGVSVMALQRALRTLRRKIGAVPFAIFESRAIAIVGNGVYISEPNEPLIELTAQGQMAFQFVLDATQLQQMFTPTPSIGRSPIGLRRHRTRRPR